MPADAPSEFKTRDGDGLVLFVLERVGPKGPVDPGPRDATLAGFEVIRRDYERAELAYQDAAFQARTDEARRKVRVEKQPKTELFAERFLKLAQERPGTREELFALCWAVVNAPASEPGKKALAILDEGRLAGAEPGELLKALERGADVAGILPLAAGPARAAVGRGQPGRSGGCRTPHLGLPELLPERMARGVPPLRRGRRPPRRSVRRQPGHPELLRVPGQCGRPQPEPGPSSTSGISARSSPGTAIDGCCAWRSSRWQPS